MKFIKIYFRFIQFYLKHDRRFLFIRSFSLLLTPSKVLVNVFLMRRLVDNIFIYNDVGFAIFTIVLIMIINFIAATYVQILYSKLTPVSIYKIKAIITDKLYESYSVKENKCSDIRDALSFLTLNNDSRFNEILSNLFNVGTQISGLILVLFHLINNSSTTIFLICICVFVINSYFLPLINKIAFKYDERNANNQRILNYIFRIFHAPQYEADIENRAIRKMLFDEKNSTFENSKNLAIESWNKRKGLVYSQNFLSNLLQSGFILAFITFQAIKNELTVGMFTSLFNSASQVMESTVFLSRTIPVLHESSLYLEKYFLFLSDDKTIPRKSEPFEELKISNLVVQSKNFTSKKISFNFKKDGYNVIVGPNGVGKTTLIKSVVTPTLILEGSISNERGEMIQKEDVLYLHQNATLLPTSIKNNITLSLDKENFEIKDALSKVFFDDKLELIINSLDKWANSEFNDSGLDLSGGEVQRLLLSRIFLTDKPIILIDEAFTEIDLTSRRQIYSNISKMKNKIIIIISHDDIAIKYANQILEIPNTTSKKGC